MAVLGFPGVACMRCIWCFSSDYHQKWTRTRLRTDFAVMYACGLREYQAPRSQGHFVLPETLCEFRSRIDEALMDELIAIQAAAAMEEGLVSPAHLVIDTFPCEQGSQRVTDATTLYKAQKKPSS